MSGIKVVATNRRATHEYQIEEKYEAGLVLTGTEIKSVRASQVSLQEGYVQEEDGELWLVNVHIARYEPAGRLNHDPRRPRKLLLHRREINRIIGRMRERGYTVVPLKMYLKNGKAKMEIALARGKRKYDKREAITRRDMEREARREWKGRFRW